MITPRTGPGKVSVPSKTIGDPGASAWTRWLSTIVPAGIESEPTGGICVWLLYVPGALRSTPSGAASLTRWRSLKARIVVVLVTLPRSTDGGGLISWTWPDVAVIAAPTGSAGNNAHRVAAASTTQRW